MVRDNSARMDRHRGRRHLLTLAIAAVLAAPLPAQAASTTVIERGTQFVPPQVDVAVGDTVSWVFESSPTGSPGHTVTFNDRDLNPNCPPTLLLNDCQRSPGDRVSRTFSAAGTYAYSCKVHRNVGMTGVVVVTGAAGTTSSTGSASSTTTTVKASTSSTTKVTSSTTTTTRVLATSSTVVKSTTTTSETSSVLLPGDAPPFSDDTSNSAAGQTGGSNDDGSDSTTVALIVGLLLVVSAGGGYLLGRLRPGRA
jgi:plastocyanin